MFLLSGGSVAPSPICPNASPSTSLNPFFSCAFDVTTRSAASQLSLRENVLLRLTAFAFRTTELVLASNARHGLKPWLLRTPHPWMRDCVLAWLFGTGCYLLSHASLIIPAARRLLYNVCLAEESETDLVRFQAWELCRRTRQAPDWQVISTQYESLTRRFRDLLQFVLTVVTKLTQSRIHSH
jgi:hypothetical protein